MNNELINLIMAWVFIGLFVAILILTLISNIKRSKVVAVLQTIAVIFWLNSYCLWALLLSINNHDLVYIFVTIGLTSLFNMGFYAQYKGAGFFTTNRGWRSIFVIGAFLIFIASGLTLSLYDSFFSAINGIIAGSIVGIMLAFIGYKQELPKWYSLGFARAKTKQEKAIADKIRFNTIQKSISLGHRFSYLGSNILYFSISLFAIFQLGKNAQDNFSMFLLAGCCTFPIIFFASYFTFACLEDPVIRQRKLSQKS